MLETLCTILFFLLVVGTGAGFKALFALAGWTGELAGWIAMACGFALILGGIAVASLISDGVIKVGRKRRDDE